MQTLLQQQDLQTQTKIDNLIQQQKDLLVRLTRIHSMLDQTQTELEGWQSFIKYQQSKNLK